MLSYLQKTGWSLLATIGGAIFNAAFTIFDTSIGVVIANPIVWMNKKGTDIFMHNKEKMNNFSHDSAEDTKQLIDEIIKLSKPSILMRIFYCILAIGIVAIIVNDHMHLYWVRIASVISGVMILTLIWLTYAISLRKYKRYRTEIMKEFNKSISNDSSLDDVSINGYDKGMIDEMIDDLNNIAKPSIIIHIFYFAMAAFYIMTIAGDNMHLAWVRIVSVLVGVFIFALIWTRYAVSLRKYRSSTNEQRQGFIESPNSCTSIPDAASADGIEDKTLVNDGMNKHQKPSALKRTYDCVLVAYLIGTICICLAIVLHIFL